MYREHFGLEQPLFEDGIAQDVQVFKSAAQNQAAANLAVALTLRDSVAVLTGPAGVGKTTLASHTLRAMTTRLAFGWLGNPPLTSHELLEMLLAEFGFSPYKLSRVERLQMWRQHLNEMRTTDTCVCVLVENADTMQPEVLAALESFTAADPNGCAGANIVLTARVAMAELLALPALAALKQRIRMQCKLTALTRAELAEYFAQRVTAAGGQLGKLMTDGAVEALHLYSGGVIRVANNLCVTALTMAAAQRAQRLEAELIVHVASEVFGIASPTTAVASRAVETAAPVVRAPLAPMAPSPLANPKTAASSARAPQVEASPVAARPAATTASPPPKPSADPPRSSSLNLEVATPALPLARPAGAASEAQSLPKPAPAAAASKPPPVTASAALAPKPAPATPSPAPVSKPSPAMTSAAPLFKPSPPMPSAAPISKAAPAMASAAPVPKPAPSQALPAAAPSPTQRLRAAIAAKSRSSKPISAAPAAATPPPPHPEPQSVPPLASLSGVAKSPPRPAQPPSSPPQQAELSAAREAAATAHPATTGAGTTPPANVDDSVPLLTLELDRDEDSFDFDFDMSAAQIDEALRTEMSDVPVLTDSVDLAGPNAVDVSMRLALDDETQRTLANLEALSHAKALEDISNSMAETLFGDAELDELAASLALATGTLTQEDDETPEKPAKAGTAA